MSEKNSPTTRKAFRLGVAIGGLLLGVSSCLTSVNEALVNGWLRVSLAGEPR
jgi:hypothetical protein